LGIALIPVIMAEQPRSQTCTTLKHGECVNNVNALAAAENPGWAALPEPDWRLTAPRSPLYKTWVGDAERDDIHMIIALILSGALFLYLSERYYGRSKAVASVRGKVLLCFFFVFYLVHNVVSVLRCSIAFIARDGANDRTSIAVTGFFHFWRRIIWGSLILFRSRQVIVTHRYAFIGVPALYEGLWVCSMALPLAALGILTQRYHFIAAALASILAGHVIWAFDTVLMLSHGDLTRTENTLGIADYVNAEGKVTTLSIWAETHHLWFIPTSLLLLWVTGTPLRLREITYGTVWVAFISMVTVLLIPRPCVPVIIRGRQACFKNNVNMNQYWWGMDNIAILHKFDYAIGTPAMITWVAHNFFYWTFNATLWLLGKFIVGLWRLAFGDGGGSGSAGAAAAGAAVKSAAPAFNAPSAVIVPGSREDPMYEIPPHVGATDETAPPLKKSLYFH